eukprot:3740194-Pleurochrysis_carterae.AAC.1
MPPRKEDKAARRLLGGQDDGGGRCKVFKKDARDLPHEDHSRNTRYYDYLRGRRRRLRTAYTCT